MKRAKTQPAKGGADELAGVESDCVALGPPLTGPAEARLAVAVELASGAWPANCQGQASGAQHEKPVFLFRFLFLTASVFIAGGAVFI